MLLFHLCRRSIHRSCVYLSKSVIPTPSMVRILNVAEKNDAAKSLADIMSRGHFRRREGMSKFNKIYEFEYMLFNQKSAMSMTSVSGHLLNFEFVGQYKKWNGCAPLALFDAQVQKQCQEMFLDIKRTLEREIRGCQSLIIWTDGDREGENIGFEIIQVCQQIKPNIRVYRARFSEITPQAIARAIATLREPDQNTNDAVDVRQELDLRIGAAFTRFQTLRLKKVFPDVLAEQLISYGSCQFPTLGFVVERYKQVQAFIPEPFWKIKVSHQHEEGMVDFNWKRQRLFDYDACLVLYEHCAENPEAKVVDVKSKPKSKWRPVALDTVEMEKLASRKLHITAKETMKIAEKLYTQGLISYPRTETNIFPKDFDMVALVQHHVQDPQWGNFAQRVLNQGPKPRNGKKTDQAHPPIHPIKYTNALQGNEKKVYDFIVRHFLACCSEDAQGHETTVEIDISDERFTAQGLMIIAKNYLEVYIYEKWNAKVIPTYQTGERFQPNSLEIAESSTSAPPLLSEADLIALMDKHGIGTDATHADHIETIKSRMYVGVRDDGRLIPGELGMGLVDGYDSMGFEMSKPHLRSGLEADLKRICDGTRNKNEVLAEQIQKYKEVFIEAVQQANKIDEALAEYFGATQPYLEEEIQQIFPVNKCKKCGSDMTLKTKKDGQGYFVSCMGFPDCREAIWFPDIVLSAEVLDTVCNICRPGPTRKIKFKFKRGSVPVYVPLEYEGCIGGCDDTMTEVLQLSRHSSSSQQPRPTKPSQPRTTSAQPRPTLAARNTNFTPRGGPTGGQRPLLSVQPRTAPGQENRHQPGPQPGARPLQPKGGPGQSSGDAGAIVCNCGDDARLLTVRKEGPNTGRQFYACPKPPDSKCDFFLWADQNNDSSSDTPQQNHDNHRVDNNHRVDRFNNTTNSFRGNSAADVLCGCGDIAKKLTVQKEGPNKGRPFHACPKPMGQGCGFFQWGDEDKTTGGSTGGSTEQSSNHGNSGKGGRGSGGTKQTGQRRKVRCGECHEEGHTKRTCPNLR